MPRVKVTASSGNVFEDLGFDKAEAEVLKLRTEMMIRLEKHLRAKKWTQRQTAERLRVSQPRVSRLMSGVSEDFSLDMLVTLAHRAGMRTSLTIAE